MSDRYACLKQSSFQQSIVILLYNDTTVAHIQVLESGVIRSGTSTPRTVMHSYETAEKEHET